MIKTACILGRSINKNERELSVESWILKNNAGDVLHLAHLIYRDTGEHYCTHAYNVDSLLDHLDSSGGSAGFCPACDEMKIGPKADRTKRGPERYNPVPKKNRPVHTWKKGKERFGIFHKSLDKVSDSERDRIARFCKDVKLDKYAKKSMNKVSSGNYELLVVVPEDEQKIVAFCIYESRKSKLPVYKWMMENWEAEVEWRFVDQALEAEGWIPEDPNTHWVDDILKLIREERVRLQGTANNTRPERIEMSYATRSKYVYALREKYQSDDRLVRGMERIVDWVMSIAESESPPTIDAFYKRLMREENDGSKAIVKLVLVCVDELWRRNGITTHVMAYLQAMAIQEAKQDGLQGAYIKLTSIKEAENVYKIMGFYKVNPYSTKPRYASSNLLVTALDLGEVKIKSSLLLEPKFVPDKQRPKPYDRTSDSSKKVLNDQAEERYHRWERGGKSFILQEKSIDSVSFTEIQRMAGFCEDSEVFANIEFGTLREMNGKVLLAIERDSMKTVGFAIYSMFDDQDTRFKTEYRIMVTDLKLVCSDPDWRTEKKNYGISKAIMRYLQSKTVNTTRFIKMDAAVIVLNSVEDKVSMYEYYGFKGTKEPGTVGFTQKLEFDMVSPNLLFEGLNVEDEEAVY